MAGAWISQPKVEVAVVPYKIILPEPMISPLTASWAEGLVVARPTRLNWSTTKAAVVVPTVNKLFDKVLVPMPTCGPLPELTKKAGIMPVDEVAVLVPTAKLPQTSNKYLGEEVAMPTRLKGSRLTVRILARVVVAAKVEEAETIMPTVVVGLMALGPMNCQELGANKAKVCQAPKPLASEVNT